MCGLTTMSSCTTDCSIRTAPLDQNLKIRWVCSKQLKAAATAAQQQLQADGQEGQEAGAAADSWLAVCRVWEVCCWLEELAAA
jgi:hypothetical protein